MNKKQVIVGIFFFVGIVILVVTIFFMTGQKKTFINSLTLKTFFTNIQGLQTGDNVWFSGVKIGTVQSIKFTDSGLVKVEFNIDPKVAKYIRKNAVVKISSDGLIGDKIVQVINGTQGAATIQNNDYLKALEEPGTEEMLATLQKNNENLLAITQNFKLISQQIIEGKGSVGRLLTSDELAKDLEATMLHLKHTATQSEQLMLHLSDYTAQLNEAGSMPYEFMHDTVILPSLRNSMQQLNDIMNTASVFTTNLNNLSAQLHETNNAIGLMTNDSAVANDIRTTISYLKSSSIKLDEDLEALQHNFFLRGFFKKKAQQQKKDSAKQKK
jgi:phospholipid/cholesterol/gamma-HCH transport system substrate-binding protein